MDDPESSSEEICDEGDEVPSAPNDDSTPQRSSDGASSQLHLSEYGNPISGPSFESVRLSVNVNPIYQPIGNEMENPQHDPLGEELDNAVLDPLDSADSTEEQPVRYPVEWDKQNYLKFSPEVVNIMARNPERAYHITPCRRIREADVEIADPSSYLLADSGYNDTTGYPTSQQSVNSTPRLMSATMQHRLNQESATGSSEIQERRNSIPCNPENATNSVENRTTLNMSPIQLKSLGACAAESSYELHTHGSQKGDPLRTLCNLKFFHNGTELFEMTVPKGTKVNTLIKMNEFIQKKKRAFPQGGNFDYFLKKEKMNLSKIDEDSVITITETLPHQ